MVLEHDFKGVTQTKINSNNNNLGCGFWSPIIFTLKLLYSKPVSQDRKILQVYRITVTCSNFTPLGMLTHWGIYTFGVCFGVDLYTSGIYLHLPRLKNGT